MKPLQFEQTKIGAQALVPGVAPRVPALIDAEIAVQEYRAQAAAILDAAETLAVVDTKSKGEAVTMLGRIATIIKKAEQARKAELQPADDWKTRLNRAFQAVMLPVTQADALLRNRVLLFDREERRLADEKAREAAKLQQAAINSKRAADALMAQALAADAVQDFDSVADALDKASEADQEAFTHAAAAADLRAEALAPTNVTKTDEAKSTTKKTWDFKIVDAFLIPSSLKIPDEKAIRAYIIALAKGGLTAEQINARIPGVEAFQKEGLSIQAL